MEDLLLSPSAPTDLVLMETNTLASSAVKRIRLRLSAAEQLFLKELGASFYGPN
jgi:hypothetical protein